MEPCRCPSLNSLTTDIGLDEGRRGSLCKKLWPLKLLWSLQLRPFSPENLYKGTWKKVLRLFSLDVEELHRMPCFLQKTQLLCWSNRQAEIKGWSEALFSSCLSCSIRDRQPVENWQSLGGSHLTGHLENRRLWPTAIALILGKRTGGRCAVQHRVCKGILRKGSRSWAPTWATTRARIHSFKGRDVASGLKRRRREKQVCWRWWRHWRSSWKWSGVWEAWWWRWPSSQWYTSIAEALSQNLLVWTSLLSWVVNEVAARPIWTLSIQVELVAILGLVLWVAVWLSQFLLPMGELAFGAILACSCFRKGAAQFCLVTRWRSRKSRQGCLQWWKPRWWR